MREAIGTFIDDLPQLDPIIRHEPTADGWRGLTAGGEIFEIGGTNGHQVAAPSEIVVTRQGHAIGRRAITNDCPLAIADYLESYNRASDLFRANRFAEALAAIDAVLAVAPTTRARANRAFMLLSAGQWLEGWAEFELCERELPFQRPRSRQALEAGLRPWRGEDIRGKRLLLLHDHGFGDSIMMLRYVKCLQTMGADVVMLMPPELRSLAGQLGVPMVKEIVDADYFCSLLQLARWLEVTPATVAPNWLFFVDEDLAYKWHQRLGCVDRSIKVGVAWSVGKNHQHDYARECSLEQIVKAFGKKAVLYSVQKQGREEAQALGVVVHQFGDFADCAALMSQLNLIVSVDTAALHLAGAIGHPCVRGLLSHWHSWRWLADWYPQVKLCRQTSPGDWASALSRI